MQKKERKLEKYQVDVAIFKWSVLDDGEKLLPGAMDVLTYLNELTKYMFVLSTHKDYTHDFIKDKVERYGISEFFPEAHIYGDSNDEAGDLYWIQLASKSEPGKCLYVCDTLAGAKAAKEVEFISANVVSEHYLRNRLQEVGADIILDSLAELTEHIGKGN